MTDSYTTQLVSDNFPVTNKKELNFAGRVVASQPQGFLCADEQEEVRETARPNRKEACENSPHSTEVSTSPNDQ